MEIERKWMVTGWPEGLPLEEEFTMRQGYISVQPTVRIREEALTGGSTDYILCFKSAGGLAREEIERSIDKDLFVQLEEKIIGKPLIKKVRRSYRLPDGAVRDVNVPQVLAQYFRESTEPLLQLGPVSVTAWQLLLFALLVGAVSVVVCLRRGTAAQLVPPCIVWGLGLAAPASWMVLSKAHAAIHTHLVPMLWHFAFVPISCMLLPVLAKLMIPGRKKDLVASH